MHTGPIIIDSSALLSHFFDEPEGDTVRKLLRATQVKKQKMMMSVIQYGEVLYGAARYDLSRALAVKEMMQHLPIQIIPVDVKQAELAANFKAKGGIAYPDCFAIALAIQERGAILTKDEEFERFSDEVDIIWLE